MAKKVRPILIIKGHEAVNEGRKIFGPGDPIVALVRAMLKDHQPDEILASHIVSARSPNSYRRVRENPGPSR